MLPHRTRLPVPSIDPVAAGSMDRALTWRVVSQEGERRQMVAAWHRMPSEGEGQERAMTRAQEWYDSDEAILDTPLAFVVSKHGEPLIVFACYRRGREIRLAGDQTGVSPDVIARTRVKDSEIRSAVRLLMAWVRLRCRGCELVFESLSPGGRLLPVLEGMEPVRERWYRLRQASAPGGADAAFASENAERPVPAEAGAGMESVSSLVSITLLPRTLEAFPRFLGMLAQGWWGGRRKRSETAAVAGSNGRDVVSSAMRSANSRHGN